MDFGKAQLFLEHIEEYPEVPSNLSAELHSEAYSTDDPPLQVAVIGINKIAASIPLRSSSKLLKPNRATSAARREHEKAFAACTQATAAAPPAEATPRAEFTRESRLKVEKTEDDGDDADEEVLRLEYELKLARLRSAKQKSPTPSAVVDAGSSGTLKLNRNPDGTIAIVPRTVTPAQQATKLETPLVHAKPELATHTKPMTPTTEVKTEVTECPTGDEKRYHIPLASLDPYAQAAVAALDARATKRKAEANEKAKEKREAKKRQTAADKAGSAVMRRPAAAVKRERTAPVAPKALKAEPAGDILKKMPTDEDPTKSNPKAVDYKQGVIYIFVKTRRFRALLVKGNKKERSHAWGKDKKASWKQCVDNIDRQA